MFFVTSYRNDGLEKSSRSKAPNPAEAGLKSEAPLQVPRSDEVEAQSRSEWDRWTSYETIFTAFLE